MEVEVSLGIKEGLVGFRGHVEHCPESPIPLKKQMNIYIYIFIYLFIYYNYIGISNMIY